MLEGDGAYTTVDGEKTMMHEGDFIITPPMAWHDHGNPSDAPMFWLDGLDIPVVSFLDASFAEAGHTSTQAERRPMGYAQAKVDAHLLPIERTTSTGGTSPVFNYPFDRTREALERMRRFEEWDACHGLKLRYSNPLTGGHAMTTMATFIQLLPAGMQTAAYRSTDATVFACIEGSGHSVVSARDGGADTVIPWGKRDLFVVPSWHRVRHQADDADCVLFSFSDRPIQEALHLFREDRFNG